jgi:PncC family amidohydrolase
MAEGGAKAANASAALAVTGIAGPDGGSKEKPVGLVYIGCCVNGTTVVERNVFSGSRREVREQSVAAALKLLKKQLQ